MAGSERGLGRILVKRRGWLLLFWLGALGALLPAAGGAERVLEVAARIPGSESAGVERMLATGFRSPFAHHVVMVLTGVVPPDRARGRELLEEVTGALREVPGVSGTFSYLDLPDSLFLLPQGTLAVVGVQPGSGPVDAMIPRLRAATTQLLPALRARHPDAALRWTGEAALNTDLRRTSAEQARDAERRAAPLTLALLLLAFGALAAAVLPLLAGFLAIVVATGVAGWMAHWWPLSVLLLNVVSMIGLGLGIDYGLLVVSRFREALARGRSPEEAAEETAREAGHTVLLSGAAVMVGFGALLWVPLNEVRSIAVGGLLVVSASVLVAVTLLPGVLAWLGPRVDLGRVRSARAARGGDGWRRWGGRVAAHPWRVLVLTGAPLLLLALQSLRLSTELPRGDWLPAGMESARALRDLERGGRSGVVHTLRLVLELPDGVSALAPEGWSATRRLARAVGSDPRVARVQSLPSLAGGERPDPRLFAELPSGVVRSFVRADRRAALLEVVPAEGVAPNELSRLVRELRARNVAELAGLPGARLLVGGLPALNVDYQDTIAGRLATVLLVVVLGTLLALAAGFRSVLVPLKAVLLNLLSVGAAMGALVLVFQDGWGAGWVGLDGPTGGVFPAVPILVFCTVFGLSMDYEVFLVARVAEARRAGMGENAALAEGLARSGGVISSAAAIMIAVFAAFTLGEFLLIKMLGFTLAVAVLLDATVVRLALGPALLCLAGRWNWWPGGRRTAAGPVAAPTSPAGRDYVAARMETSPARE